MRLKGRTLDVLVAMQELTERNSKISINLNRLHTYTLLTKGNLSKIICTIRSKSGEEYKDYDHIIKSTDKGVFALNGDFIVTSYITARILLELKQSIGGMGYTKSSEFKKQILSSKFFTGASRDKRDLQVKLAWCERAGYLKSYKSGARKGMIIVTDRLENELEYLRRIALRTQNKKKGK